MAEPDALTELATRAARAEKPRRKATTKAAEGGYESDFSKTSCRKAALNPFLPLTQLPLGAPFAAQLDFPTRALSLNCDCGIQSDEIAHEFP